MPPKGVTKKTNDEDIAKKLLVFLKIYALTGNIAESCRGSLLARRVFYDSRDNEDRYVEWQGRKMLFGEAVKIAFENSTDILEEEAVRRATVGREELVLHQGKVVMIDERDENGEVTGNKIPYMRSKVSDVLLIFMLKARRPGKFADHRVVQQTGTITHNHKTIRELSPEDQHKRMLENMKSYSRMSDIGEN